MGLRFTEEQYALMLRRQLATNVAASVGMSIKKAPPKLPRTRSAGEAELELRLEEAGITGWRTEYEFAPSRRWKLDFAWPRERLAVEVDGSVHRIKGRFARDFDKHNALTLAGWMLLRFSAKHIATGKATETIRAALALRAAETAEEGVMSKRVSVNWTCSYCGKEHRWRWERHDTGLGVVTKMQCDYCGEETPAVVHEDGRVEKRESFTGSLSLDAIPAGGK